MAGVDLGGGGGKKRKFSKRKPKKRMNIRIDMTPMVDVAFLLLTFFMLTTVFRKPQTIEINLPPSNQKVEMAESNLMTLRIDEKSDVFWNLGIEKPHKLEFKDLRNFLNDQGQKNPRLVILVKIDRKSKYGNMIEVLDELNLANLTRFSISPMTDIDKKEMLKAI